MQYIQLFLLFSILSLRARAWKLDASCDQMGVANDVRNGMNGAFNMVDAARTRLTASPRAADTDELIGYLFAKEGQNPSQLDMRKTRRIFDNINQDYRAELTPEQDPGRTDIVIFCNLDRFVKVQGRDKVYRDRTDGVLYKYNEQSCRGSVSNWLALAVTTNPFVPQPPRLFIETRRPTQLQLCPWFVDWIKNKEFKLHRDVRRTNVGQHVIKAAESSKYGFRQVDVFSLLDKVLLHEMMHGRIAWTERGKNSKGKWTVEEGLDDVTDPSFWSLGLPAYGWKRAMSLARKGEDLGKRKAPDNNAETMALFASVCLLLDDENNPRRVDMEGKVVPRT